MIGAQQEIGPVRVVGDISYVGIIIFALIGVLLLGEGPITFRRYAQTKAQLFSSDICKS